MRRGQARLLGLGRLHNLVVGAVHQQGRRADILASAMRNAAANFTAFAETRDRGTVDVGAIVEEFRQMLDYYAQLHRQQLQPATGLERLVEQVKKE